MNKQIKKRIQKALEAPKPNQQEKARFLRTLPFCQISICLYSLSRSVSRNRKCSFYGVWNV